MKLLCEPNPGKFFPQTFNRQYTQPDFQNISIKKEGIEYSEIENKPNII